MSATPNITALVVPIVVPSGMTSDPFSIRDQGFPSISLASRRSDVSVSKAYSELGAPGTSLPATLPWWQARQFMTYSP